MANSSANGQSAIGNRHLVGYFEAYNSTLAADLMITSAYTATVNKFPPRAQTLPSFNINRTIMAPREKIWSIQYVRGIAALVVIVWHTGWSRTVLGQSGVDLFFIVSGFVMMLVSGRDRSPVRFGASRLARIVPLYWGVTLLVALLDHTPIINVMTSLLFWPDGLFPVVIQGWSLNLEMFYYFLFASTLLALARWRLPLLSLEIAVVCVILPVIAPTNEMIATWSSPLAFEFLAGTALHLVWQERYLPVGLAAWVTGAAGVGALITTHLFGGAPEGWMRIVLWGLPALAIVGAGLGIKQAGQLPRVGLLAGLGEAYYSIYLTHFLVIRLLGRILVSLWAPVAVSIVVAVACVFGWAIHHLFERPAHRWTNAFLGRVWPRLQPAPN